jgi:hypothetical protein
MRACLLPVLWLASCLPAAAQITIATDSYNQSRTGVNASETVLTPASVASGAFQKIFTWQLDGYPYAQPLYILGSPDLLIAATMNDTVYAFNADSTFATSPVWTASLIPAGEQAVRCFDGDVGSPVCGILSTPVYDPTTSTIYAVSFTKNVASGALIYRLHALDLATGAEKFSGPSVISSATIVGSQNMQRPGLALANGQIYVGWGSWGDAQPWIGYVTAYSASTLALKGTFAVAKNGASVWQGGRAPAVDGSGSVYFATGNGKSGDCNFGVTFGNSIMRLTNASGANLGDWFTTSSCTTYDSQDADLGSGGPLLFGSGFLLEVDKGGNLRVLSTSSLGHEAANDAQIVQLLNIDPNGGFGGSPAYFNGSLYAWGASDYLKAWAFNGSTFNTHPALTGGTLSVNDTPRSPSITISAKGTTNAIAWVLMETATGNPAPGILRAINASTLVEIWNSNTNSSRDSTGNWIKFRAPVVDNGRVFVESASSEIPVYGLVTSGNPLPPSSVRVVIQ